MPRTPLHRGVGCLCKGMGSHPIPKPKVWDTRASGCPKRRVQRLGRRASSCKASPFSPFDLNQETRNLALWGSWGEENSKSAIGGNILMSISSADKNVWLVGVVTDRRSFPVRRARANIGNDRYRIALSIRTKGFYDLLAGANRLRSPGVPHSRSPNAGAPLPGPPSTLPSPGPRMCPLFCGRRVSLLVLEECRGRRHRGACVPP